MMFFLCPDQNLPTSVRTKCLDVTSPSKLTPWCQQSSLSQRVLTFNLLLFRPRWSLAIPQTAEQVSASGHLHWLFPPGEFFPHGQTAGFTSFSTAHIIIKDSFSNSYAKVSLTACISLLSLLEQSTSDLMT